ncbi:hypothetical protein SAMN05421579_12917 [Xenorhabdus japonica]|uniref:Uncharacterized protein n=1 Tax=Xenorhabdus japonica TaxID=53341 RepID=A0A1I5CQH5_9GAMM|nr:hypothetical protein SAMN05421579_12917 [Xenorhabdus japonica]
MKTLSLAISLVCMLPSHHLYAKYDMESGSTTYRKNTGWDTLLGKYHPTQARKIRIWSP